MSALGLTTSIMMLLTMDLTETMERRCPDHGNAVPVEASEIMHTFGVEDGLTEEAAVALLRDQRCHKPYTHISLEFESTGKSCWGKRGLHRKECQKLKHEWYEDNPALDEILSKVRGIYGLGSSDELRETLVPPGERPRPLYIGTPTSGDPSLLNVVQPKEANHLRVSYLKNLLLHPPPHRVAECIQGACAGFKGLTSSVPDFTCVSAAKLKRLIESKEANHVEFSRIQRLAEDVLYMSNDPQLTSVLDLLLEPAWLAIGYSKFVDVLSKHMHDSVLGKLEKAYESMMKQAASSEENDMIVEPNLDTYVFCRSKTTLGTFQLDDK